MINRVLLIILITYVNISFAQEKRVESQIDLIEGVFTNTIRSVELYPSDYRLGFPILNLGEGQTLTLKFDDLSNRERTLTYTVTHCDRDWKKSNIAESDYLDGFQNSTIYDFEYSQGTITNYTNYLLELPNSDVNFKISGNYLISIFDKSSSKEPIITRKFYIVENLVPIKSDIIIPASETFKGENQELFTEIDYSRIPAKNVSTEISVWAMQNGREDMLRELHPQFIRDKTVEFRDKNSIFEGGNEFRNFEIKRTEGRGMNVAEMKSVDSRYHAKLMTNIIRQRRDYTSAQDINGKFFIESTNRDDSDLESEYVLTHFTLTLPQRVLGGNIYIYGALSNWNCNPIYEMHWSEESQNYKGVVLLKQGVYNYQYVYLNSGMDRPVSKGYEGSYYETENRYQTLVYYRPFGSRYDKLVGYANIGSRE